MKNFLFVILVSFSFIAKPVFALTDDHQLGVCAHLFTNNFSYTDSQITLASTLNVQTIRWDAPWKMVEVQKGQLVVPKSWDYVANRINTLGMNNHIILDYGNQFYDNGDKPISEEAVTAYLKYVETVVTHFKGKVKYYQVWNEWNGKVGNTTPGNAKDYYSLLKRAYPLIKSIDPNAVVIGGGFSTTGYDSILGIRFNSRFQPTQFEELLKTDAYLYMDMIAIHPYVTYRDSGWNGITGFKKLADILITKIRSTNGFNRLPVVVTEIGWSTALDSRGVTEELQKDLLQQAVAYLQEKYSIPYIVLYNIVDGGNGIQDMESNFGLYKKDMKTPKPAATIFKKQ